MNDNSNRNPNAAMIQSPCRSKCHLDPCDVCMGCGRTLGEIIAWGDADCRIKVKINEQAGGRLAWTEFDGRVKAVMATGPNGEVGMGNGLPWSMPSELKWFKLATAGKTMVVGRSTWEAMKGDLPGRNVAVVSGSMPQGFDGASRRIRWVSSVQEGADWAFNQGQDSCLIGGPKLWASSWHLVEAAWITKVDGPIRADSYYVPDLSKFAKAADGPSGLDGSWSWKAELWHRFN